MSDGPICTSLFPSQADDSNISDWLWNHVPFVFRLGRVVRFENQDRSIDYYDMKDVRWDESGTCQ